MKQLAKTVTAIIADLFHELRGYRFPDYFCERDRVKVLLFGIEPDVSRALRIRLKRGMTVLDIGGNVGLICRICAKRVGPTGHVWTFEPDPYTRSFLVHNVSKCKNVTVSPFALSDENSITKLHIHPASGTANSLLSFEASSHAVDVECMTLDSFLDKHPNVLPDCIKIDVEGAEPKVLAGMRNTIERFQSMFLIVEFCPKNLANGGYSPGDYFEIIKGLGLTVEIIHDSGNSTLITDLDDLMSRLNDETYCNLLCYRKA